MIFEHSSKAKIHYNTIGTGKTQILFLHGFCASQHTWDYMVDFFDKEKYTLIFIDLLGHGNSSVDKSFDYSIISQANIVNDFINFLGLKDFIIIGHSYGGSIALLLSVLYGKSLSIKNLVLIDAGAYAEEIPFFIKQLHNPVLLSLISFFRVLIPKNIAGYFVLRNLYFNKKLVSKNRINKYSKFFSGQQFKAIVKAAQKIIPDDFESYIKKYPLINIPSLIIWGKNDSVISLSAGKRLKMELNNSELKIIDNCGHIPQEEKPEDTFNNIKNFLQ